MHRKNLVICDTDKEYAKNLMEEFSVRKGKYFQFQLFQDLDQLENFLKVKKIQILLIGEDFPVQKRMMIPAEERFVLVKERGKILEENEKEVYRYQSSDKIFSKILEESEDRKEKFNDRFDWEGNLVGIYSPVHRIGKTRFAFALGKKMSEKGPVLYLNLEEYSGLEHYFSDCKGDNLGDLLYYVRQENVNLRLKLSEMTASMDKVDYVAPIPVIQDLNEVSGEEWLHLFGEIFACSSYQTIILDMGDSVKGLYSILRQCTTVYTLQTKDRVSQAKIRQYTENLRLLGYTDVLEHTVLKQVPIREGGF